MPQKVLIVDDSKLMRMIIRNALSPAGYEVVGEAKNGREGVDLFVQLRPDVVTMDMNMPEMDGMTAIKEIMRREPRARIIVVSSLSQETVNAEALKVGAKSVIGKPFEAPDLVKAVNSLAQGA